ncbi:MAG: hypothetical protein MZV63_17550 [Marinilabiliales bacterium]|nr:hypothetical protein [Marinilabiliales bacterium]
MLDSPDNSDNPYLKIGITDTVPPWKRNETIAAGPALHIEVSGASEK